MSVHYIAKQHQEPIIAFILRGLPKSVIERPEGGSEIDVDNHPHTTTSPSGNINAKLKEIFETIDTHAREIQALNEESQRLSTGSLQSQASRDTITEDLSTLKSRVQEQNTLLNAVKVNQGILCQVLASLQQKIKDLQFVSTDGTLIWRVERVAEKTGEIFINKI